MTTEHDDRKVSERVDRFLEDHEGEDFRLASLFQEQKLDTAAARHAAIVKLRRLIDGKRLEKSRGGIYRVIDNTLVNIDWSTATEQSHLDIRWPSGIGDETRFTFDGHVFISPGDIIVVAGGSNFGKTTWVLNFLWANMDNYPCRLMGNEYQPSKFRKRVSPMTWADPLNEHGAPKFDLIERYDGWKDAIDPDKVNIIDWINLDDKFYMIGAILQGIRSKLRDGIAVVVLQKTGTLGMGGGFSKHLASLYLLMDFERMTVEKAKEWDGLNPNGMMDRFKITNHGTQFSDIHRIILCPQCRGYAAVKFNPKCQCKGKGYLDYESQENVL